MKAIKKTALLKQSEQWTSLLPIRGVARLEEAKQTLTLSLLNLEKSGGGEFYVFLEKNIFKLENLSGQEFLNVELPLRNEAVILVFYDGKKALPVAVGCFSLRESNIEEVVSNAKRYFKAQDDENEKGAVLQVEDYNDETIADENYYEREGALQGGKTVGIDEGAIDNEGVDRSQGEQGKEEKEGLFCSNESVSSSESECGEEHEGWDYGKIKREIKDLLANHPREESLCNMVESSRWVKIGDNGKHYAVGVILKEGEIEYVCYGLPSVFDQKPQKADGFPFFIPISPFDLKGEGYWVSIQNAKNGKCVE